MSSNLVQRVLWVLWPSFMVAAVAELLFFAVVDPHDMSVFGVPIEAGRMTGYAVGFFFFWGICAAASALTVSVSLAVMAFIGWISGLGFGWLFTLGTANVVRSWMSPPTLLALGTGQIGILLGLGDHTTAVGAHESGW